jgi:hypothetical protein
MKIYYIILEIIPENVELYLSVKNKATLSGGLANQGKVIYMV